MGTVTNLKEWKEKKLMEKNVMNNPHIIHVEDVEALARLIEIEEPIDDAFEMAQNMYDSRKDRMLEEQANLDSALEDLDDKMKILEEASTKVLEDAKKRT